MREFELVVPAYNESKSLDSLIQRTAEAAQKNSQTPETFQLVVVNNGSTDNSPQVLDDLSRTQWGKWFRVIDVYPNAGYGNGIWQGLLKTQAKYVGWTHADGQCDPADAFKALGLVRDRGKVLAKGVRFGRKLRDIIVSRGFEIIARIFLGLKVYEMNAQPKVFPSELLQSVKNPPSTLAFDLYVLYHAQKQGYETETLRVFFPPRIHGASKWAYNLMSRFRTIWGVIQYIRKLSKTEGRL